MSFRLNPREELSREVIEQRLSTTINANLRDEKVNNYQYPRDKGEWWAVVDNWWVELLEIAEKYVDMTIVCPRFNNQTMYLVVKELKKNRDPELAGFFHAVWNTAPDHGSIHANPGWVQLCDLCSEDVVLYEDKDDPI